jgi:hypothetical protein
MSVTQPALAQTLEDIHSIVYAAVAGRRPISAVYENHPRLFCPHRLGKNREGERRVLCYQYGGASESGLAEEGSPKNWRCIALGKLGCVVLREDVWRTAPNHSRPQTCIVDVEIDVEDQPAGEPQKGQQESRWSR